MEEVNAKGLELRMEMTRQAIEAQAVMGEPAPRVAPIESEIRIYTRDIVKANHDKDFRSLAVFPLSELEDCKLVVVRADYKGDVVVETVTGTVWQPGGWIVWTLIWRGHMLLLQPPESLDAEVFLDRWQPHDTPALGFLFFWHSRHDQERTAPGPVACRLCRGRKAGDADFTLCRRNSNRAAAAIVGCIRAGAEPGGPSFKVRGRVLCFQEVFAGSAVLSSAFEAAGVKVMEPIEVFEDPHRRQGYREAFDLTLPQVQKDLIYAAGGGPANIWWIASPCTSFCDWGLQNMVGRGRSNALPGVLAVWISNRQSWRGTCSAKWGRRSLVLFPSLSQLQAQVAIPRCGTRRGGRRFWPGPMSLLWSFLCAPLV